jgi:hypothetical protein
MASPDLFALSHSALNPFLYADISLQGGATTLTIASLFGRCGYDPWEEAARLARLPAGAAIASLAAMIEGVPMSLCSRQEATAMADRLVALLPRPARVTRVAGKSLMPRIPPWPLGTLASFAAGLGVAVAVIIVWMAVTDGLRPQSGTGATDPAVTQETSP